MAAKLPSEIEMIVRKKVPGPGTYELKCTEMRTSGSYFLTKYRNNVSPKYFSPTKSNERSRSNSPTSELGPGQCKIIANIDDINHQKFGQSIISKFKNSMTNSFGK